ncbi:MAG: hypothetical protein EPN39_06560 [Chitinophagaceae bacterium]|nr:MAG: hypothetical protein EPN39_06560 [Chitinophagaceae bacterium]
MKKLFHLLMTIFIISLLLSFSVEGPIFLKVNLHEGATYKFTTTIDLTTTTSSPRDSYQRNSKIATTLEMKVSQKYRQDSMVLVTRYTRMAVRTSALGQTTSFDSNDKNSQAGNEFRKIFHTIKDHPVTLKTNASGRIIEIIGISQLRKALFGAIKQNDTMITKVLENLLNEQAYERAYNNLLNLYPQKSLQTGDHWDQNMVIRSIIPLDLNQIYTVKEIKHGSVILNLSGNLIGTKDSAYFNGTSVPVHISGTQFGQYTIDRSTGLISNGTLDEDLHTKINMSGKEMDIENQEKTHIMETTKL